jgi:predicted transcriptional regulator of viral defense system
MARKVRHAPGGSGIAGKIDAGPARERALHALAERQYGVVGHRQLVAIGFSDRTIARWIDVGRLHRLHRGAYAVGRRSVVQRGSWLAAVLTCEEGAALSHASAAALWGLVGARGAIDVTAPGGNQGRGRLRDIKLHRGKLDPAEITTHDRIPVTSVARTLFDYAEVADFQRLERAWEEADRLKRLRLVEVERVCERGYGRRALKPTRKLLAAVRAVTRTRSPLEDRFQRFAHFYDLPPHSTNVDVLGSEVDVLWPAAKLIVELDSWEFHSHRAAFQRDRARDTRLLVARYRTIRVTHERLDTEAATLADEIRELLRAEVVPSDETPQQP